MPDLVSDLDVSIAAPFQVLWDKVALTSGWFQARYMDHDPKRQRLCVVAPAGFLCFSLTGQLLVQEPLPQSCGWPYGCCGRLVRGANTLGTFCGVESGGVVEGRFVTFPPSGKIDLAKSVALDNMANSSAPWPVWAVATSRYVLFQERAVNGQSEVRRWAIAESNKLLEGPDTIESPAPDSPIWLNELWSSKQLTLVSGGAKYPKGTPSPLGCATTLHARSLDPPYNTSKVLDLLPAGYHAGCGSFAECRAASDGKVVFVAWSNWDPTGANVGPMVNVVGVSGKVLTSVVSVAGSPTTGPRDVLVHKNLFYVLLQSITAPGSGLYLTAFDANLSQVLPLSRLPTHGTPEEIDGHPRLFSSNGDLLVVYLVPTPLMTYELRFMRLQML